MALSSLFKPFKVVLRDQHQSYFAYSYFISLHKIIAETSTLAYTGFGTDSTDSGEFLSQLLVQHTLEDSLVAATSPCGRPCVSQRTWRALGHGPVAQWRSSVAIYFSAFLVQRVCQAVAEMTLGRIGRGQWLRIWHACLRHFDLV